MTETKTIKQTGTCPICGKTGLKFGLPTLNGRRVLCSNEYFSHVKIGASEYIIKLSQVDEIIEPQLNLN